MSVFIYAINIGTITLEQLKSLEPIISKDRQERAYKYKFDTDKIRCIIGECIVRYALLKRYDLDNDKIIFRYSAYGKPYLPYASGIYFNISHAGKWVVCAVSNRLVGIDIEQIKCDHLEIAKSFFTTYEYGRICSIRTEFEKYCEFYKLWTLKESYIKAIGVGLSKALNTFEFHEEHGVEYLYIEQQRVEQYKFQSIRLSPDYQLSLCTEEIDTNNIEIVSLDELILFHMN